MAFFAGFCYTRFRDRSAYLYAAGIAVLLLTLLIGRQVRGTRAWLGGGMLGVQPSEFCKITTILFLSAYLARIGRSIRELRRFAVAFGIVMLPTALVLLQPDTGTAAVYLPIFLTMAFMTGARVRHLVFIVVSASLAVFLSVLPAYEQHILGRDLALLDFVTEPELLVYCVIALGVITGLAAWGAFGFRKSHFYWIMYASAICLVGCLGALAAAMTLKDYQVMRLIVFLDPTIDPRASGWHTIQSTTAVGSGGLWGKGFLQGTQSQYRFLPAQSTDFIFSVLSEEWGFAGGFLACLLLLVVLLRGVRITYCARDEYGRYVGAGIVGMMCFHVFVNVGMALGIMPITGIPLFFLSYGGSSLWTGLIAVGLLLNIHLERRR